MTKQFELPDLGEGIHEGEILEVPVSVGDEVQEDDIIVTVETDKASVEIPSPYAGKVQEIHVKEGDLVNVGDVIISFGDGDEGPPPEARDEAEEAKDGAKSEERKTQPSGQRDESGTPREGRPVPAAPATRRLARELNVDLRQVAGSGPGGRVTRDDVQTHADEGPSEREAAPGGEEAKPSPEKAKTPGKSLQPEAPRLPDFSKWGEIERLPLRSVRRVTAQRMAQSWSQIPHVTHHDVADVTDLEQLRQQYQDEMNLDSLTLTLFVMKAVVAALKKYPRFNASLDADSGEIILKHYYNLGLAVDTDRGLIVPVTTDVESKSLVQLAKEIRELVERTRAGKTELEEMQGGTFTITNVGPIGGTHFDPIVNFPQAAILGMARVGWEPVVEMADGQKKIEPRYMLPLVLGFDHRLADGAEAARFVNDIVTMLEDPDRFMLRL
ncbi:MAG: 2-oxo acid dehydrogenase subunit E2 [Chloroflexi bacterium]|nr:2-oxo acid dehydrogenase subunit E2 [Chloroflexota bacterium]